MAQASPPEPDDREGRGAERGRQERGRPARPSQDGPRGPRRPFRGQEPPGGSREGSRRGTEDRRGGGRGDDRPRRRREDQEGGGSRGRPFRSAPGGQDGPRGSQTRRDGAWQDRGGAGRAERREDRRERPRGEDAARGARRRGPEEDRGQRRGTRPGSGRGGRGEGRRPDRTGGYDRRDGGRPERERSDRPPAPEVDADLTGQELDRQTQLQVRALEAANAEVVARHLAMVGRYLDLDPQLALEHARYAVSRGGRVAPVREAAGVAAYQAGEFHEALRELRTYRRMTGDPRHLPLMVDCERALDRPERALELAASGASEELPAESAVELAMVVAGIREDAGDAEAALSALEIPQLDRSRGFSYSPRLFRAYAHALRGVGRGEEAPAWERQAVIAEAALGAGQFSDPEIVDLGEDDEPGEGVELISAEEARRDVERVGEGGDG